MIKRNPAMLLGVTLPFVIATALGLRPAAAMTLEFFAINFVTALLSALFFHRIPLWIRAILNVGVATAVMMFTRSFINFLLPDVYNNFGTYLYLMALNGVVLLAGEEAGKKRRLHERLHASLRGVAMHTAVFAVMMFVVAFPRELFGNGTLWGRPITMPFKLPGMLLPFFGFISVGVLLAFIKFLSKKISYLSSQESARRDARDRARYTEIHVE
jgi:Na+-translocating ferredoxin:NAD+ oxidoreductase RnfE subunit